MSTERNLIDIISHGVYLIGVKNEGKTNFMTAAWITQISSNPETILVAFQKNRYTAELIRKTKWFSVNSLLPEQREVAKWCGFHSGRKGDKTENMTYQLTDRGIPIIESCAGFMECELKQEVEYGDHVLFIAEVAGGRADSTDVMLYHEKDFFGTEG